MNEVGRISRKKKIKNTHERKMEGGGADLQSGGWERGLQQLGSRALSSRWGGEKEILENQELVRCRKRKGKQ